MVRPQTAVVNDDDDDYMYNSNNEGVVCHGRRATQDAKPRTTMASRLAKQSVERPVRSIGRRWAFRVLGPKRSRKRPGADANMSDLLWCLIFGARKLTNGSLVAISFQPIKQQTQSVVVARTLSRRLGESVASHRVGAATWPRSTASDLRFAKLASSARRAAPTCAHHRVAAKLGVSSQAAGFSESTASSPGRQPAKLAYGCRSGCRCCCCVVVASR